MPPSTLAADPGLARYVAVALRRNLEVRAARQGWQAALARVDGTTALPDPRVTVVHFVKEVETRVGPQQNKVGVAQSLPWRGSTWS